MATQAEQTALANTLKSPSQGGAAVSGGSLGAGADVPKVLAEDPATKQLLQESVYTQTGQKDKAIASSQDYTKQKAPTVVTSDQASSRNSANQQTLNNINAQTAQDNANRSNTTGATSTTRTTTPTSGNTTESTEVDPLQGKIDSASAAIDAEYAQADALLTSRMSSLSEQSKAQIAQIQATYAARREETKRLNEVLLQSNTKAGIRAGRQRYAPEINQGILTDVEQQGLARITQLDNEEQQLIMEAQAANDSNQFNLLSQQLEMVSAKRKEKEAAISALNKAAMEQEIFALDKAKTLREFARYDREDASASIDAMVEAGLDPATVPQEYLNRLDSQAGYVPGTSQGLMDVGRAERQAKTDEDQLNLMGKLSGVLENLQPDQSVTVGGIKYYGTKNNNIFEGYEIDQGTGNITSIYRNDITGEMTYSTQEGVLEPNVDYDQEWLDNGDGTESLWYVPKNPKYSAIPVNPNVGSGKGGVNAGVVQEKFPNGFSYSNGGKEAGMSEKDFWCLRWGANLDVRGQDLMNEVGNTIQEKRASVEPDIGFDGSDRPPQVGDFILTNEDSTFGHFALINDIRTDPKTGKKVAVLSESNYKPLTVDHTRTITLDSSNMEKNGGKILGFKHSELKPEYTNQPESELSGGFTRPTKEAKETTTMSVPQQTMLRTEIAKDKAIVQYSDLNNTFESMDAIAQTALAKPTKESRASLDQALVTLFNKMLDPTSVVREGEYARTAEGQSVLTRAEGFKAKLQQGGAGITDATRRDMVEVSRILRDVAEGQYQDSVDFYIPIIEQGGLEPSKFIKGYGTSPTRSGTSDALKTQYPQYSNDIQSMLDEGFSLDEIEEALSGL